MISFITIQDLTETEYNPNLPRKVSLAIDDDTGDIHLLGELPYNTKLGIDAPNAKLLIEALLDRFPPDLYSSICDGPVFLKPQAD